MNTPDGDVDVEDDHDHDDFDEANSSGWAKGIHNPNIDSRVNIWSLNGFSEPVFTGGVYQPDEIHKLEQTVKDYCASKNVTASELCSQAHKKEVRNAWQEIAQCLPHRTVLSVYRRALRQFHGMTRGTWSKEEVASLFHLVGLHGHKWKVIQDKLGRSATDCRVKFFASQDQFERGKWSVEGVELLLQKVRSTLKLPRKDMDVREINQWTLDYNRKIPWTSISWQVNRGRQDCYYKWKQMTKRSNKKAVQLGYEPVPMARESHKFDVRFEYYRWKAEQDPKFRQKYINEFVLPLLQKQKDGSTDNQKEKDIEFLDSIIVSKPTRPSEVSWQSLVQGGNAPRERWDDLVDTYAPDDAMDLPLWKLATLVKSLVAKAPNYPDRPNEATQEPKKKRANDNQIDLDNEESGDVPKKKRKRKKQNPEPELASDGEQIEITGVPRQDIQNMIKDIIDNGNRNELTVRGIRKQLEKQLGVDLSSNKVHKDAVKMMVKEVL